jgi:hypothetical protein
MRGTKLRLVFGFCFFAFLLTVGASSRPAFAQCDKVTDDQIVSGIYAKIKADKRLASQISHINVVSLYSAVKLQGWADSKSDYDKVYNFAMTTDCAKLVNVNNFQETAPPADDASRSLRGCGSGTKACGDICIPESDVCNIGGLAAFYEPLFKLELGVETSLFGAVSACW